MTFSFPSCPATRVRRRIKAVMSELAFLRMKALLMILIYSLSVVSCKKETAEESRTEISFSSKEFKYDHHLMIRLKAQHIFNDASGLVNLANQSYMLEANKEYLKKRIEAAPIYAQEIRNMPEVPVEFSDVKDHLIEMSINYSKMVLSFKTKMSAGKESYYYDDDLEAQFVESAKELMDHYQRLDMKLPDSGPDR